MKHWSVDEEKFKREHPGEYRLWRLAFEINYGLPKGKKLDRKEVKKAWSKIKDELDPYVARALEYILWKRLYSLPPNITFYNWPKLKMQLQTGSS